MELDRTPYIRECFSGNYVALAMLCISLRAVLVLRSVERLFYTFHGHGKNVVVEATLKRTHTRINAYY